MISSLHLSLFDDIRIIWPNDSETQRSPASAIQCTNSMSQANPNHHQGEPLKCKLVHKPNYGPYLDMSTINPKYRNLVVSCSKHRKPTVLGRGAFFIATLDCGYFPVPTEPAWDSTLRWNQGYKPRKAGRQRHRNEETRRVCRDCKQHTVYEPFPIFCVCMYLYIYIYIYICMCIYIYIICCRIVWCALKLSYLIISYLVLSYHHPYRSGFSEKVWPVHVASLEHIIGGGPRSLFIGTGNNQCQIKH